MLLRGCSLILDFGMLVEAAIVEVALAVWHRVEPTEGVAEPAEAVLERYKQLLVQR